MKPCPVCRGDGHYEQRSVENHSAGPKSEVWRDVVCDNCGGDGEVDAECDQCGEAFKPLDNFHTTCWGCLVDEMNPQTTTTKG